MLTIVKMYIYVIQSVFLFIIRVLQLTTFICNLPINVFIINNKSLKVSHTEKFGSNAYKIFGDDNAQALVCEYDYVQTF